MLGNRIKELRKEKGVSQQMIAEYVGVSQKAIDYWEREINEPKASYIVRLAEFFDCSADYLLGREDDFGIIRDNSDDRLNEDYEIAKLIKMMDRETKINTLKFLQSAFKEKK